MLIGADFLHHFNLMVDHRNKRIIDKITNLSTLCIESIWSIKAYTSEQDFTDLIKKFPSIITAQSFTTRHAHSTVHYIETRGPPVFGGWHQTNWPLLRRSFNT